MSFLGWMTVVGALLLVMALSSAQIHRAPVSTAAIYLAIGVLFGPWGLGFLKVDIATSVTWFERLTEIAVIVSLFVGGLRLRLPLGHKAWRAAYVMAGPVMLLSIVGVALFAHFVLGLAAPVALLIGAVLAPTDPVLASPIAVSEASDQDRMRYGISGEAGLNDGMAFPFVVFALLWAEHDGMGGWVGPWALHRLLWAVPAGLLIGGIMGRGLSRVAIYIRSRNRDTSAPGDFLALAVIALAYVAAEAIGAWGFLSVFAAGVGVGATERKVVKQRPHPAHRRAVSESTDDGTSAHPPAEDLVALRVDEHELEEPAVAAGLMVGEVLTFGDTVERILEFMLVVIVGVALLDAWSVEGILLALALFFVIRPLATWICLTRTPTTRVQRAMMGWFGIRGIGSLYYLSYALSHRPGSETEAAIPITLTVIAMSVVLHGITGQPILMRYERSLDRRKLARAG